MLALAAPVTAFAAADAPKSATIGAASVGGTYYVWATGFAKVLNEKMPLSANVEVTGGPVHNVQLVNGGQMAFGLATAAPAYEGYNGLEWAKGKKFENIRSVFPMFPSYFHWWALEKSGVKSIRDFTGKVVALGPKGGTPDAYGRRVLEFAGIKPSRIVNVGFSDVVGQLRDGLVDTALNTAGVPHPSVMESESTDAVNIIGVPEDLARGFIEKYPYFGIDPIPAAVYKSLDKDLPTLTVWNFIITNKDLPEDFVYNVTRTVFENTQTLIETHRSSESITLANVEKLAIPLHPGALRYYREKGVSIPDRLIPPESGKTAAK
ncbi:hypothetical protein VY88_20220 [Azospirillum thiophilum]|uniref:C4-dicarboxylate ABC transporter substrate-binding protein n=2 Tax=Azospirillum thiophilum TaxID=528244 RepID=A0AAC8ZVT2_9PROT|nr:hypothetical protein AL072_25750 [Azospirillum thiophilum]KJR63782.1 hypothetical protein VY88_20220 [Azospirillum thiophilum]